MLPWPLLCDRVVREFDSCPGSSMCQVYSILVHQTHIFNLYFMFFTSHRERNQCDTSRETSNFECLFLFYFLFKVLRNRYCVVLILFRYAVNYYNIAYA